MQAKKLVTTINEQEIEIEDVTVLSKDEYDANEDTIALHDDNWWLRTSYPYSSASPMMYVAPHNDIGDRALKGKSVRCTNVGVSPALKIKNVETSGLDVGDKIEIAGISWTVIEGGYAQCDEIIGYSIFRKNYKAYNSTDYNSSDLKKWLYKWAKANDIQMGKDDRIDTKWAAQTIYRLLEKGKQSDEMKDMTESEWSEFESFIDDKIANTWQPYPEIKPIIDDDYLVKLTDNLYDVYSWCDNKGWSKIGIKDAEKKVKAWMEIPDKQSSKYTDYDRKLNGQIHQLKERREQYLQSQQTKEPEFTNEPEPKPESSISNDIFADVPTKIEPVIEPETITKPEETLSIDEAITIETIETKEIETETEDMAVEVADIPADVEFADTVNTTEPVADAQTENINEAPTETINIGNDNTTKEEITAIEPEPTDTISVSKPIEPAKEKITPVHNKTPEPELKGRVEELVTIEKHESANEMEAKAEPSFPETSETIMPVKADPIPKQPIKVTTLEDIVAEQTKTQKPKQIQKPVTSQTPELRSIEKSVEKPKPIVEEMPTMSIDDALKSADSISVSVEDEIPVAKKAPEPELEKIHLKPATEGDLSDISEIIDVPNNTIQTDFEAYNVMTKPIGVKTNKEIKIK